MSFFFQAEDGIRDADVTGVQTYALPIYEAAGVSVMMALAMPRGWRGATALGFAFWALDNLKPWPIWWIEEWPGAMGIMGDDIAAGAFIALVYLVVRRVYERQAFRRLPKG